MLPVKAAPSMEILIIRGEDKFINLGEIIEKRIRP